MKFTVSHPLGNPNSYQTVLALQERGLLGEFHTCLFTDVGSRRRFAPYLQQEKIRTHPGRELLRLACRTALRGGFGSGGQRPVDWVAMGLDRAVAASLDRRTDAVYCYEDSACETFRAAAGLGIARIYDLPIGYQDEARAVALEDASRHAGLGPFFGSLHEPDEKRRRKRLEIENADLVVCASTYTRNTILKHVSLSAEIRVVPYGCDQSGAPKQWGTDDLQGPARLLFAGRLDPRKGLHYLFEALEKFAPGTFDLMLAGTWVPGYREWLLRRYRAQFQEAGQVGRERMAELMRHAQLLVFPSLFEGFGLVLLEAMGYGIPVLATERTGAPDILSDGEEGFLVQAGSSAAIVSALEKVLARRERLAQMGAKAYRRSQALSWSEYRSRVAEAAVSVAGKVA